MIDTSRVIGGAQVWVGVVENRFDPLHLGRLQVRIAGIHPDNKLTLPTEDLPWATPLQGMNSAAISGVGVSPTGVVEGTWCVGIFMDPDSMQIPLILGTVAGYPTKGPTGSVCGDAIEVQPAAQRADSNTLRASDGSVVTDASGTPVQLGEANTSPVVTSVTSSDMPPLTEEQIQKLKDAIGFKESSSIAGGSQNYTAKNRLGYVGKYQFGAAALATLGYVRKPASGSLSNSTLEDEKNWTGKGGVNNLSDYFNKPDAQETIMRQNLKYNYGILKRNGTISANSKPEEVGGYLAAAHLLGAGGATSLARGSDSQDANGVTGRAYYKIGAEAVAGTQVAQEPPAPAADTSGRQSSVAQPDNAPVTGTLNNPVLGYSVGFEDPFKVYPKCSHINRSDLSKLATGDKAGTIVEKKAARRTLNIQFAGGGSWEEPLPAFCTAYPYNQVIESEAGHVIELDNTPGQERVHVYHKSGSYIELDVNGSSVRKVTGDGYELFERNLNVSVKGQWGVTVEGPAKILVKNSVDLEVYGKTNAVFNNDVDMAVAGDFKLTAGGDVSFNAGGRFNIQAGSTMAADADKIWLNSGRSFENGIETPASLSPSATAPAPMTRPDCTPNAYLLDAGEPGAEQVHQQQVAAGEVEETSPAEKEDPEGKGSEPAKEVASDEVQCAEFASFKEFPDTIRLSAFYTLGDLSSRAIVVKNAVRDQRGLKRSDIVCNLKALAVNCLDPIKRKYPNMIVTNAFRAGNSTSDHELGKAADLQFTGVSQDAYFDIVCWIRDNIPYKQLLLEYGGGARNPWIHIAFSADGAKSAMRTGTFRDHKVYAANKFVNLA